MKLFKSNGKISFITSKGELILSDKNVPDKELQEAYFNNDEEKIIFLISDDKYKKETITVYSHNKMLTDFEKLVEKLPNLFEFKNEAYYRKGIEVSLPKAVITGYLNKSEKNELQSMDNFWSWLCLCPNEESRKDLLVFIEQHGLPITKEGFVLAYRRVVSVTDDKIQKELLEFISNSYIKIKTKWKKNPANFYVYKIETLKLETYEWVDPSYNYILKDNNLFEDGILIGNLKDMYGNLEFLEKQFTDNHTKKLDYRIGVENRMERSDCNENNKVECSRAFHIGSKNFSFNSFGDTPVLVCFNPKDVIATPLHDSNKMRVCAFTILGVLDKDEEAKVLDNNEYEFQDILDDLSKKHMDELDDLLNETVLTENVVNNKITKMSLGSIKTIKNTLSLNSNVSSNNYESI